jgi:hypothetical protein
MSEKVNQKTELIATENLSGKCEMENDEIGCQKAEGEL